MRCWWLVVGTTCLVVGCQSSAMRSPLASTSSPKLSTRDASVVAAEKVEPASYQMETASGPALDAPPVESPPAGNLPTGKETATEETLASPELITPPLPSEGNTSAASPVAEGTIALREVAQSVRMHFPLVQVALANRRIASGEALSAAGAFDHKLDAFSESQPLDFYENYRHSVGVKRDTYWGGQVFAGYRVGRGEFEPWYLERETNKGGEFKAGFVAPLIRDQWIDQNRAELWQAQLEQRRVEPEIQSQIILFVRDASVAYYEWVAAGANYQVAQNLLQLAEQRTEGLEAQVEAEQAKPIDLVDNRRIVVSREAKVIDARRKLEQSAVKLSLYFRNAVGEPQVANNQQLPTAFPSIESLEDQAEAFDVEYALGNRPELSELNFVRRQLNVALRQAGNETLPNVDAGILVGQDVGEPTSSKRDKSEFELEARLTLEVPLERRKALGKLRALRGKLAQVEAKTRFQRDRIVAEVQLARAALQAAAERVQRITEGYRLANQMQEAEQTLFNEGQSTLFNLNLREMQAAEAAAERVAAEREYFVARANYLAALGIDQAE